MEKITLLLILVLLKGAVHGTAAKNLCDGNQDGKIGSNGVFYWKCQGGAIKSVGCEKQGLVMSMQPLDAKMSMECVPKGPDDDECIFDGSRNIGGTSVKRVNMSPGDAGNRNDWEDEWTCEERGLVSKPMRPYSTATNECQHYLHTNTLKPGSCAYFEIRRKSRTDTFVIECITDKQNPTVPKEILKRKARNGESVAHCEKWSPERMSDVLKLSLTEGVYVNYLQ